MGVINYKMDKKDLMGRIIVLSTGLWYWLHNWMYLLKVIICLPQVSFKVVFCFVLNEERFSVRLSALGRQNCMCLEAQRYMILLGERQKKKKVQLKTSEGSTRDEARNMGLHSEGVTYHAEEFGLDPVDQKKLPESWLFVEILF